MKERITRWFEIGGDALGAFASTTPMTALKNGAMRTMCLSLIGSVFMLFRDFPVPGWGNLVTRILGEDWKYAFNMITSNTMDIIALVMAFTIAYEYAKAKKQEPISCGLISLACFFTVQPNSAISGETVIESVLTKSWLGGAGSAVAIIVALFVGYVYCTCYEKDIRIKLPETVPAGVADSISSLLPGCLCVFGALIVTFIAHKFGNTTLAEIVYKLFQVPLQGVVGSPMGLFVLTIMVSVCWFFGIHNTVLTSVINPFLRANQMANQALIDAGMALTTANGAFLVTLNLRTRMAIITGTGLTGGLVLAMLFCAKSKKYKAMGKFSLIPTIFNINEPVLFGFPIVMNFRMLAPFVIAPMIGQFTAYFATVIGFIKPFGNLTTPTVMPPIISGFCFGWQYAVVQAIIILEAFLVYLPFFKREDKIACKEEAEMEEE